MGSALAKGDYSWNSSKEEMRKYLKKFDFDEVAVLKQVYTSLRERSDEAGIDKQTFLQFFPLPGLWGERLFQKFDFKSNGVVDYEEFLIGIAVCCRGTKTDKIRVIFEVFDLNNDGWVQKSELVAMLSNLPDLQTHLEQELRGSDSALELNDFDEDGEELLPTKSPPHHHHHNHHHHFRRPVL
eukprot:GHVU01026354.1.p1 GENE.GHVU01026354.1~~GHVU01026354.1.p1  ORF type:complete len:183 (-),score=37.01 GHVU01026354.1:151-699(-)